MGNIINNTFSSETTENIDPSNDASFKIAFIPRGATAFMPRKIKAFILEETDSFISEGTSSLTLENEISFVLDKTIEVKITEEHPLFDENGNYCFCPNIKMLSNNIDYNLFTIPRGTKVEIDDHPTQLEKDTLVFVNLLVIPIKDKTTIKLCDNCSLEMSGITSLYYHMKKVISRHPYVGYTASREYYFTRPIDK